MRQSASMAEIATEDGTGEEEEEQPASEESKSAEGKVGEEGETTGNEGQTSDRQEVSSETRAPQLNLESDSDTEDEEEVVTKSSSPHSNQTPQINQGAAQPLPSASRESSPPSASPAGVISGITVTESSAPPGTPPSPGRCISVSSPGRGHKIFMVTRVESPPEQQQLQLQLSKSAAPAQTKGASEKPTDATTTAAQRTQPPAASQTLSQTELTQGGVEDKSPAPSTDCELGEQGPVAHLQVTPNTTHALQPQSASPPTEDVTASTLHPEEMNPSQQTPTRPSDSTSAQLTDETAESAESCQTEPACVEGQKEGEDEDGEDQGQMAPHDGTEGERARPDELSHTQTSVFAEETQQQHPLASAQEQLQNMVAAASEETQSPEPREEEAAAQKDAPGSLSENQTPSLTMKEEPCPHQLAGADKQGVEAVLSEADQQGPSVAQGEAQAADPPPAEHSANPEPASAVSAPPVEVESSADGAERCAEAPEEDVVGSALPNGLKPEFSLHLLDTESPKPGSCVMEHGELHRHELEKLP